MNPKSPQKFPILKSLLIREYDYETLSKVNSGADILPLSTREKVSIRDGFPGTADVKRMNGDNILLAAFYNTKLRSIFKNFNVPEMKDDRTGYSYQYLRREIIREIEEALETTNFAHSGKHHRSLISLMINVPNMPEKILLKVIEGSDVLQRDCTGKNALDAAALSMIQTQPLNTAAVVAIFNKAGITNEETYSKSIKDNLNENYKNIVSPNSYIQGFRDLKKLSEMINNAADLSSKKNKEGLSTKNSSIRQP